VQFEKAKYTYFIDSAKLKGVSGGKGVKQIRVSFAETPLSWVSGGKGVNQIRVFLVVKVYKQIRLIFNMQVGTNFTL